ncbi:hypothetical protein [Megasphaera elsdenii]|uniref:hypothetical protein n=1 Tax=Megasphaera elsdenii TaxID=907 RepID=UPI0015C9363E|nr:hypothetical protein [Megasphaera elsdenii]
MGLIGTRSPGEFSQTDWISRFLKSIKWPNTFRSAKKTSKTYFSNKKAGHLPISCLKQNYFLRDGVCANALAAAVFEALLERGFRKTLDAAEAAFLEVCLLFLAINITYLSADYTIYCVIKQESVCIL